MNRKAIVCLLIIFTCVVTAILVDSNTSTTKKTSKMKATVLEIEDDYVKVIDSNNAIYTFSNSSDEIINVGDNALVTYQGKLDKNKEKQTASVVSLTAYTNDEDFPSSWNDEGIFSNFYLMAYNKLKTLSQDEKIGQILLARTPDKNQISDLVKYKFGGYVLYERDFKDKTRDEVIKYISGFQENANIPLLIAVDEEGGKVTRISSNPNLVNTPFKSSSELYKEGGFEAIKEDTINKSKILSSLGINLNLAPVIDVANDPSSYIYDRTLKEDTKTTSSYAKTVIEASMGTNVSYTLKHFPGYGDNADTHTSMSTDNRTYAKIFEDDIPPFRAGIKAGAEAVLVSHNTVPALDKDNPASLSASVHNILRNDLSFTGVIMTDDLNMGAITDSNAIIKAILAGNDILIVTDYENAITQIKKGIEEGKISEAIIDKMAFRALSWKYYKGLMYDVLK